MNQQEIIAVAQGRSLKPSAPAQLVNGTGFLFFGGLAALVTLLHAVIEGPGHPLDTITGILYTIGAVSLSPFFFHALFSSASGGSRFAAAYLGIFCFTAPYFYLPDFVGPGMALGMACLLLSILPTWFRYFRFQGAMQGIEEFDPESLVDALRSGQSSLRSMARIRLIELGEGGIPTLIQAYRRASAGDAQLRGNLLDILKQLSQPPTDPGQPSRRQVELMEFWKEQLEGHDFDVLHLATAALTQARHLPAFDALVALLQRELQRGGGINRPRDLMFDHLFLALAVLGQELFAAGDGRGTESTRELVRMLLEAYLRYPGPRRAEALQQLGGPVVAGIAGQIPRVNPSQRQDLIRVLVGVPAVAALPVLLDLVQDPAAEIRLEALRGLIAGLPHAGPGGRPEKGGMPEAMVRQVVDVLVRLSGDPVERVRLTAIEGLSLAGVPQAMPILMEFVASSEGSADDAQTRGRVAANLARTRDPLVLEPLMRLLEAQEVAAVSGAARGLGFFRDPRVLPRLQALMKHPEPAVVESAAAGLAMQGDESGRPVLFKALTGSPTLSRAEALEALLRIPDERLYAAIEAGLGTPSQGWSPHDKSFAVKRLIDDKKPGGHAVLERLWNRDDLDDGMRGLLRSLLKAAGMLSEANAVSPAEAARKAS